MIRKALITGITGQDGYYLSRLLLEKGYDVHGLYRRVSTGNNTARIEEFLKENRITLHCADAADPLAVCRVLRDIRPDEIYNLSAQSHVQASFENPFITAQVDALGTLTLLEGIRLAGLSETARFYQAGTSELFGNAQEIPQNETTPFRPRSPYGAAKLYAHWITVNYREAYGIYACNGILFNHESPLRGEEFVTRKITRAAARIHRGLQDRLLLGNLDARRDWGHAADYAEGMWRMMQQDRPDDYVLATGITTTVRDFAARAFAQVGITLEWRGAGAEEQGIDAKDGRILVTVDPQFLRPAEVDTLCGDASKAREKLGWRPKITLDALIAEMVERDLENI